MKSMMRISNRPVIVTSLVAVTFAAGCESPLSDSRFGKWIKEDPREWQLSEGGTVHSRDTLHTRESTSSAETDEQSAARELPADSGVADYVAIALTNNPSLIAARQKIERLGARVPQVTSLDDPMFQIAPIGEMAQTAAGQVGLMTGISQKVPWPQKLGVRGDIAEQDVAVAVAELQQKQLQVVRNTRRAYWSYYFTARAIGLTRESRQLLTQFRDIAQTQYAAGTRSQADVLRASVELSELDNELITLQQRQDTARAMLNQLMDRPVTAPLPEPAVIAPQAIADDLDRLLSQAALNNPALKVVQERIKQFRHRRKLAQLAPIPDLTVSLNYNVVNESGLSPVADGDDQWWLGFGINIPIWFEKYEAAEREALRGIFENTAELTAEQNRVAFEVQEALLQVEAQQRLIELFHDTIVPQAHQTVEASESGYRAGSVEFLTLIDNWRKMLTYELMEHQALVEMEQAVADLERVVGTHVQRRTEEPTDEPK